MNFSEKRETNDYINDMESGKYVVWIEKYPKNINEIFSDLMVNSQSIINEDDIKYFKNRNVDFNDLICIIDGNPSTPLMLSCDYRNYQLIDWLCKHGADPNVMDDNGLTAVDMLFTGHNQDYRDREHTQEVWTCLKRLVDEGNLMKRVNKWVVDECCANYMECPGICEFLENCELIDDSM